MSLNASRALYHILAPGDDTSRIARILSRLALSPFISIKCPSNLPKVTMNEYLSGLSLTLNFNRQSKRLAYHVCD